MTAEVRVKHLWDCAASLEPENHCKKLIKSYLLNVCREVAGRRATIPLERFAPSQMCERCSTHWHENEYQMKLRPQTLNPNKSKTRRLIEKLKAQSDGSDQRLLSKKQKKRAKWLLKRSESKVEMKCGFCQHKTMVVLNKPMKEGAVKDPVKKEVETCPLLEPKTKNKKKKKNKNISAGLKIPKVLKEEIQEHPKTVKCNNRTEKTAALMKKVESPKPKSTQLKSKNPIKKELPKVQSKTQKQNSILQLAALLKSQEKASSSSSSKNRIENFLK